MFLLSVYPIIVIIDRDLMVAKFDKPYAGNGKEVTKMDTTNLVVEGEIDSPDLEWHLAKCTSILLVIELFLGDDVKPVAVGNHMGRPVVTIEIEGFKSRFQIWETFVPSVMGGLRPVYVSDFDFSTYVDTRATITGDGFLMLV